MTVVGCATRSHGKCRIIIARTLPSGVTYAAVLLHEQAHCNGWKH